MDELRKCIVNDKMARFHRWSEKSMILPPTNMIGGHGGGIVKGTVGIIEYADGTVHECYPNEIRFIDGKAGN